MNGKNAKLLRKMGTTTKSHKRRWNMLTAEQKHEIRTLVKEKPELVANAVQQVTDTVQ